MALDETGSLANVRRNDFLPFGEELTGGVAGRTAARGYAPTNINQKFTGHERDASTGYDHTLWRKLDSIQGRWTSPDPYGGSMEIGNPQSFNRYSYVLNDPVNLMDPLGLNPFRTTCYLDGIQSDCGFAMQMVDIGSAILEGGGSWTVLSEDNDTGEVSGVTYNYATNLNLMFRNPFPASHWILNGLSNTVSDLIGEREIAIAAQQAGNPNESTETRLLGAAMLGVEIISNLPGGQGLKAARKADNVADGLRLNKSLASQSQIREAGMIMAGPGGRVPFRGAERVARQYGGNASDWVKKTSSSYTARDGTKFETHWVENIRTGQRVEFKTKFPGGD